MAFKMKGFSGPFKQIRSGKFHGPINKQNEPLMPGEHEGTWVYGRGYKGGEDEFHEMERARNNPKLGNRFVKSERIADYEDRAEVLYNNELWDAQNTIDNAKGRKKKKAEKKKKQLTSTINKLQHEADILRDSSFKKKSPMKKKKKIKRRLNPIDKHHKVDNMYGYKERKKIVKDKHRRKESGMGNDKQASPMKLSIELGDNFTGGGASHAKRMRSDAKYRQGQSKKASKAKDKHAKRVERRG